jgi:RHS repeat-associated protein
MWVNSWPRPSRSNWSRTNCRADGNRVLTVYKTGTTENSRVYTPFPDYEVEDPAGSGANITRTTYRIAGQIVALQTHVGTAAVTYYYAYTDHLGIIVLLSYTGGTPFYSSFARYDPFGNYRSTPATTTNPAISNHGFTGHRHNNTGIYPTQNVGLIYMNARYYLPEVGRFISADSIVPCS